MPERDICQMATAFVDLLVPGSFSSAKARLSLNCEYHDDGKSLTGEAIIGAFKESHEKAAASLDSIEYLPAVVETYAGDTVVVAVADRICRGGREHVYSDRLAITIFWTADNWSVTRIEHRPIEEERRRLREFLDRF